MYKIAIIGGGITSLSLIWNLKKHNNLKIDLYEKNDKLGGLARTYEWNGYKFDFGVHLLHVHNEMMKLFLKENLSNDYITREFKALVEIDDKFYRFPPSLKTGIFSKYGYRILYDYLKIKIFNKQTLEGNNNFESWVISKMGRKYYEMFFEKYSEKWWGISPINISDELIKYAYMSLFRNSKIIKSYPKSGPFAEIFQKLIQDIFHDNNIKVHLKNEVEKIEPNKNKVKLFLTDGKNKEYDFIFNTTPINVFLKMLNMKPPKLSFRSLIFCFLVVELDLNETNVLPCDYIHFSSRDKIISRIHEPKRLNKQLVPNNHTSSLSIEIPADPEDIIWSKSDEKIVEIVISNLSNYKNIRYKKVLHHKIIKIKNTHPIYHVNYFEELNDIKSQISKLPNIMTGGRLGEFKYVTSDHAVEMGMKMYKSFIDEHFRL